MNELFGLYSLKSFEGIFSLTISIIPPPVLFLSRRNGELKPSIANSSTKMRSMRSTKCLIYSE